LIENRPLRLNSGGNAIAPALVEIDATHGTQTRAIEAAQRRLRGIEQRALTNHRHKVELIVGDLKGLGIRDNCLIQLINVGRGDLGETAQATAAQPMPWDIDRAEYHDAIRETFETKVHVDDIVGRESGIGEPEFRRGNRAIEKALGARAPK
jgi:hypothetical protein